MKNLRKAVALLCVLSMAFFLIVTASAAVNTQQLIVKFENSEKLPVSGSRIQLYRIGTRTDTKIIPNETFSDVGVDYEYADTAELSEIALTLEGIAAYNKIPATYTDVTDEKGEADFGGTGIEEGAYLVVASAVTIEGVTYIPAPVIISLPHIENGVQPDVVTLGIKSEQIKNEPINIKVLKVWKNDTEEMRTPFIKVAILRNGSVYETQKLSAENGWSFTWYGLSPEYRWTIVEMDVPTSYTVQLSFEGITYVVTNDGHRPDGDPIDKETTTSQIPSNSPGGPDYEDTTHRPHRPDDEDDEELPYTGTNIRFVPYLAIIGTLFFIGGYASYRKGEIADEQE